MEENEDGSLINFHERIIERYIEKKRPPIAFRDKLDLGFTFKNHVVEIFEIRPRWDKPEVKLILPFAKSRYYKSKNIWKIYWKRANGNWELYEPQAEVRDLSEFLKIIDEDTNGCFFG